DKASLFINGEEVRAIHTANAHTDGDSLVWFKVSNVIHMGDIFFNLRYPFIDHETGGTIDGTIQGVEKALKKADGETIVIPGHGPVTDRAGLEAYLALLKDVRARVAALKGKGKSLAEVQAAKPSAAYDEVWSQNFVSGDMFIAMVYETLP
ncbi:MAG TPA: MBL fold metallo-hydrolase, partial [Sphingomonadales bacterium]|nr:MBL fold metallo-hydrolase [Sphingomonadales bacterium]